jgi:hypothetical protein
MPADNTFGSDQDKMSAPVAAESADHHPEELVAGAEPRSPPSRPCQHRELMTQQEIFGDQRLAVAHDCTDEVDEQKYIFEHRPNIMPPKVRSRPGRLLRPHTYAIVLRFTSTGRSPHAEPPC